MSVVTDPYALLGVPNTATMDEAGKAFKARARKLHPDLHRDKSPEEINDLQEQMKELNQVADMFGRFKDEELYAKQQGRFTRVKTSWTAAKCGRGYSGNSSSTKEKSTTQSNNPAEGAYEGYRSKQANTNTAQGATQQPKTESTTGSTSTQDTSSQSPNRGSRDAVGRAWRDLYPKPDNYLNYVTKKPIWKTRFRAEEQNNYRAITLAIMHCSKHGYKANSTRHGAYVASIFPALVQQSQERGFLPSAPSELDLKITTMLVKEAIQEKGAMPYSDRGNPKRETELAKTLFELAGSYDAEHQGNKTILMLARSLPMTPEIATMALQHCTHDSVLALVKQIRDRTESKGKNKQLSADFVMQVYSSLSADRPERAQVFMNQLTDSERKAFQDHVINLQKNRQYTAA